MSLFQAYLAPSRTGTSIWLFLAAFLVILIIWLAGTTVLFIVGGEFLATLGAPREVLDGFWLADFAGVKPSWWTFIGAAVFFLSVAMFWPGAFLAQIISRAPISSLYSYVQRFRWGIFAHSGVVVLVFYLVYFAIGLWLEPEKFFLSLDWQKWALSLLILFPVVFLQAGGEEVVFRGWLVQQAGRIFHQPWIIALLPAIGFSWLHGANSEVVEFGPAVFLFFFVFSLLTFWLVYRTGGLEAAIALHTISNLMVSLTLPTDPTGTTIIGTFSLMVYEGAFATTLAEMMVVVTGQLLLELLICLALLMPWSPLRLRHLSTT